MDRGLDLEGRGPHVGGEAGLGGGYRVTCD